MMGDGYALQLGQCHDLAQVLPDLGMVGAFGACRYLEPIVLGSQVNDTMTHSATHAVDEQRNGIRHLTPHRYFLFFSCCTYKSAKAITLGAPGSADFGQWIFGNRQFERGNLLQPAP